MAITSFDSIFTHIGGFGRYQMMLFVVNCYANILFAFVYFGQLFMCLTPPHWCRPPPYLDSLNLTREQVRSLTVPLDNDTGTFHQCRMYDVNFTQVMVEDTRPNSTWPTRECGFGWHYDFSLYYPTITSQLNWVCEDDWKPPFAQSIFFVGSLVASPVWGWASDRWGRLPVVVLTNVVGGVAGVASAFSTSFLAFTILRFIVGLIYDAHYMIIYILLLEYVSSGYRTVMANVPIMIFLTFAMCAMPWMAIYLADWTAFTIVTHASQFLCITFIWLVPESARWLMSQGRVKRVMRILRRAAKVNKMALTPEVSLEIKEYCEAQAKHGKTQASALDLLRTPVLRLRFLVLCVMWMVISLAYDGHIRNTQHIGSNVFVTFTIVGFVELPADFVTMILVEKLGRRITTSSTLVLSGLACLVIALLPSTMSQAILVMAVVGRFLITMSINVGQQYPVEVLPTVARGSGSSLIHTLGHVAGFVSPYVVYLSKVGHYLPYTILAVISVGGGCLCMLLPETLDEILPDTLHDGETFFNDQGFCYLPWVRKKRSEAPEVEEEEEGSSCLIEDPAAKDHRIIKVKNGQ